MKNITCKFGGTSLADAPGILRAVDIVQADKSRRFIVPSAPGKRSPDDKKITDLLLGWFHLVQDDLDPKQPMDIIEGRFVELAEALDSKLDVRAEIAAIAEGATEYTVADYLISRGEFLNGRLIAERLGADFVDPAEFIKFDFEGGLDPVTYEQLGERLSGKGLFVIPGFYGADPDGRIKTFSRGGSDVTGAVVARASGSDLYENWTDVSGFRMTDPRLVPDARRIDEITYAELRELAYMGASVIHDEAIFPIRDKGIPLNIRNTHDPEDKGTMIVAEREATHPICGIASRDGFSMISIEKTLMNKEVGFGRRILGVLEEFGVNFEHMPTGIDTMSLIVKDEELKHHGDAVLAAIQTRCEPDKLSISKDIALIATVGQAMNHHIGVASRLFSALSEAKVNIRVIDQGSSEMNIIVGVHTDDLARAVNAIYDTFKT